MGPDEALQSNVEPLEVEVPPPWIVCQIGAREHYVLAAELHRRRRLAALCTDAWVKPGSLIGRLAELAGSHGKKLRERYSPLLCSAQIIADPLYLTVGQRLFHRASALTYWDRLIARNELFGKKVSDRLRKSNLLEDQPTVFSYSYAARRIFETAKEAGCMTVLGQIDPGPFEDRLVAEVAQLHGLESSHTRPPEAYWANWRQECDLADWIVVNSSWSRYALIEAGVSGDKVCVVPLAYAPTKGKGVLRRYPTAFTHQRPLRLLFLGQINIRKGVVELLQAMQHLIGSPVCLSLVGHVSPELRERFGRLPNVDWLGPVSRSTVSDHYHAADAFILPTHSDGFAITQLEAASHGLPLIVSTHCGDVINDSKSGLLVEPITAESIEASIQRALEPGMLDRLSSNIGEELSKFTPERVVDQLVALNRDML